jgi:anti-sigma factor RsiW
VSPRERHPGDRLAALVDGRLGEAERAQVLAHLAGCAPCRADYDAQLALKGVLGELDRPGAPSSLQARLAGLPAAPAGSGERSTPRPSWSGRRKLVLGAATAGSLVLVTVGVGYAVGAPAPGPTVVPTINLYTTDHAAVSGDIPLEQPQLSQLTAIQVQVGPQVASATTAGGGGTP